MGSLHHRGLQLLTVEVLRNNSLAIHVKQQVTVRPTAF